MSERGLRDKVVIVTGAGGGIARATAEAFAAEGCRLVLTDIDEASLLELAAALRENGTAVETTVSDVTSEDGAKAVIDLAIDRFGQIDVLANVVGGSRPGLTTIDLEPEGWETMLRLNLTSTYLMSHFALPHMERQGKGAIVNVSSGAGLTGMKANPGYVAAKAGVVGLTRSMAIDHAPNGVRVNCIAPGGVLTPLMRRNRTDEEIAFIGKSSLVGRVADPSEMADAIVWLASDEASYVVGQTISVNGGSVAGV